MRVLVTGGAGFIGSHLVERLLALGIEVTVLDNFDDFYDPLLKHRNVAGWRGRVRLVEADVRDKERLRALFATGMFSAVIHLAARAGVRPSLLDPDLYAEVNILGTQHLLELSCEFQVKRFVFASSSSVYGLNHRAPFREDDPATRPVSPYAATKLAGEALCHVYHHLHGLDVVCLRFFTVYGPRQRPDLAIHRFVTAVLNGEPLEVYGDGSARRDFTFVDDVVAGICACLKRQFGFEIINLGESRTISVMELIRLIERTTGVTARIRWLAAQPGDVPLTHADISKARRWLGYDPATPIEVGIGRFVEWLRAAKQWRPAPALCAATP